MRTLWSSLLILVVASGTAVAQPGQTPPTDPYPAPPAQPYPPPPAQPQQQPQPYPQPYPQQQPPPNYVPAPYQYQPVIQVQLTAEDQQLLDQGEITNGAHLGGAAAAFFLGFGTGQIVQGRWSDTGWIFTLGETASIVSLMVGVVKVFDDCFGSTMCHDNSTSGDGYLIAGLVGLTVFRTWEVVDAFVGPPKHNQRVRELRMRLGMPQPQYGTRLTPYVNKTRDGGGTAGLSFRF
ncbi:MAG: hypothetical protein H6Q90_489 [Deltaproteobacteria bacterium]|nr:hypothetical protein [Deltaproteobacteria bacterium]